jgi:tetratricopeptide (TPR) repeat protein
MSLFKRKKKTEEKVVPDPATIEATTPEEYENRGMLFYSHEKYDLALADFQQAIALRPDAIDPHYSVALTYKAMDDSEQAIAAFKEVISLLDKGLLADDPDRVQMLRRISNAQIHSLSEAKTGSAAIEDDKVESEATDSEAAESEVKVDEVVEGGAAESEATGSDA